MNCYECEYSGWCIPYKEKCENCGAFGNFKRRTAPTNVKASRGDIKSDSTFTKDMPQAPRGKNMILGKAGGKIA